MELALPQNIEAEKGVLGSILIDPEALVKVGDFLMASMFYRDAHRTIYEAMLTLFLRKEPPDFLTLPDELERMNKLEDVGGPGYIASLVNGVPTSGNIEHYARIVERTALCRELIHFAGEVSASAYAQDDDVLSKTEQMLYRIGQHKQDTAIVSHTEALTHYMDSLGAILDQKQRGVITGVPTGYVILDKLLGGLRPKKMIVLAGRPGTGKTSLALNIADTAVKAGCNVLFFSLEMDQEELMQRWVSMEARVDSTKLRDGRLEGEEESLVYEAISRIAAFKGKMWIDDTCGLSHIKMRSKAMRMQVEHGIDLILVDYLQLATADETERKKMERRLEVEEVSRNLKGLARELDVPVLALAQLSRAVEQRASKIPQLSDLREAGGIEQDSDVVILMHKGDDVEKDAPEYNINLLVEKHRSGPMGVVTLRFIANQTRYHSVFPEPKSNAGVYGNGNGEEHKWTNWS